MNKNNYSRLVIFDIDGTLVHCGPTPRRVFKQALLEVFGTAGPIDGWVFDGKTDPQIVRELMTEAGVEHNRETVERALNIYVTGLQTELPKAPDRAVYPGVRALLEELVKQSVLLGLLTGNIKKGARAKLESLDLWEYFAFGAFADDSAVRKELADIAVQRAFELSGQKFTGKQIVIIGDTEHDTKCGRHLGVKAIGVGTGRSSAAELLEQGADFAFADFSDHQEVARTILL
ncbi:HAD hydrolase-like protein [candidate division TA06 bacterium]|uniref:HAD hydrolase-like protein n=1 Tax=candidate division TA06 bacterium TaxID=2250710 RepID=A0A933IAX7_UNCT6|nr:HAD hydrolase-like protein [candidate division TA06 bacterium]